ncbi:MAG: phage holin family protein [Chloroflexota bacterium]|nr:phage holin family protein [Chloroflexota bacterium]
MTPKSETKRANFLQRVIIRLVINAAALYLAAWLISGIHLEGWKSIVIVAAIFGVVNTVIKPVVSLITCLLQAMTLGLLTIIINVAMLYLTEWVAGIFDLNFQIDNFWSALLAVLIIGPVSFILSKILK